MRLRNNPSIFSRSSHLKRSFLLDDDLGPWQSEWEKTVNKNYKGNPDLDGTFSLTDTASDFGSVDFETPKANSSDQETPPEPRVFCKRVAASARDLPVCDFCTKGIAVGEIQLTWTTSSGEEFDIHEGCCIEFATNGPLGDIHVKFASTLCDHHARADPSVFKNVNLLVDALLSSELELGDSCPQQEASSPFGCSEDQESEKPLEGDTLVVSDT